MALICLDYDKTYTVDPELWQAFIALVKERGHEVICATMRHDHESGDMAEEIGAHVSQIIFTKRAAKGPYLAKLGIKPDIWIDDNPAWILEDSF